MRTRFLNTDYCCITSHISQNGENLTFLHLPIPNFSLSRLPNFVDHHLFGYDPFPNISLEIRRLPIDAALSLFISQVTPQKIESEDLQSLIYSKKDGDATATVDNKHERGFKFIRFEEPVLDAFTDNVFLPEGHLRVFSEAPEIEIDPGFLRPEIKMQNYNKVQESVYSVDDVTVDYDTEQNACDLEDDDFGQEQMNFHLNSFPLLEVDELGLRNFADLHVEDEFLPFPENIKSQRSRNDYLLSDQVELLGFTHHDVLAFLSEHYLSKQILESELASNDMVHGMDVISMVDNEESAFTSLPMNLLFFQEYEFLETDSSHIYEVFFKMQTTYEPGKCDLMCENKNFKNFNDLVVCSELVLSDEIFKTLPAPILSDSDKVKPLHAFIEKIFDELKPQPLSAFDDIYLDWHLLEEDKCNTEIFSSFQNMLELDSHKIDFDWEYFDNGKEVTDIDSSDYALDCPKVEEHEETLNMFPERTSNAPHISVDSVKLFDDKCSKSGKGKNLSRENSEKVTLLFKSMSQFNDLDFFLNPGKVIGAGKSESSIKAPGGNSTFPKEGESHSIFPADKHMDKQSSEDVFGSSPIEDNHNLRTSEAADKVEANCTVMAVPTVPCQMKTGPIHRCLMSSPEIVIVVNTQNLDKEMIVSRRSTYQKILAMEKEGLQVVERDLDLPVDVIVISAICLVWYNCRNIRKKSTAEDEASSCLPLCMENIATNVLTLLSYTFSCCILVFEGDINFLSTVMESSDGLYAAAASLGIDLQLFCSYSSELTDEIIVSNVCYATKLYKGGCPKMPETETLAESFLTKFPSINPLTAHAILSSEGRPIEFLGWSNERRTLAVQQFHVPEESVALFSALCSYGEREDSKSIMTDCSSSVSSGPDSSKDHFSVAFETRPRKCIRNLQKADIRVGDIWQPEPSTYFTDDIQVPSISKLDNCWASKDTEILDGFQWPGPSLNGLFGQKQGSGIAQMVDSCPVSKQYDSQKSKGHLISEETNMPGFYLNDSLLDQNLGSEMPINKLDWSNTRKSNHLHGDALGEVIDLTDNLGKDVPSITNRIFLSTWLPETEEDSTRKSKAARRLSFGRNIRPTFPPAGAINSNSDLWSSVKDYERTLLQNYSYPDSDVPIKHTKELLDDILTHGSTRNTKESPFKEEISHFGGTPLSKAIHSANTQPGSPWTIEFLNRIREKSRLRQQSFPCDTPTPDFGCPASTTKVMKRRSPSILEFFRYKGGGNPGKTQEQKKQKRSKQSSRASKNERTQASFLPTWTPADKRSRQTLSFAMNGSGSQTRLVWSDGNAHRQNKKLRYQ